MVVGGTEYSISSSTRGGLYLYGCDVNPSPEIFYQSVEKIILSLLCS